MSTQVVPMSIEEYFAGPETPRAEYVDGCMVVNPPAILSHQYAAGQIRDLLNSVCGRDHMALQEVGWLLGPTGQVRIPDVAVIERSQLSHASVLVEPPVLAIEVPSPDERPARKLADFGAAGLQHYWTFEP